MLARWLLARTNEHERRRPGRGRAHSTRARYQTNGRAARALITASRRSYFTPRSSIIHAVNNAPLFRVTLYRGLLPSFLPSSLPPALLYHPLPRLSRGDDRRGLPRDSLSTRGSRSGCVLYPVGTLLSPGLSSKTETRFSPGPLSLSLFYVILLLFHLQHVSVLFRFPIRWPLYCIKGSRLCCC